MSQAETRKRDANTLRILGAFFMVLGLLVLVATGWTWGNAPATIVNLACGTVLSAVGAAMTLVGLRSRTSTDDHVAELTGKQSDRDESQQYAAP